MSKNFELLKLLEKNGNGNAKSEPLLLPGAVQSSEHQQIRRGERSRPVRQIQGNGWMRAVFILQKHWRFSLFFAFCVLCITVVFTLATKPVYEPTVTLEIDPPGTQAFAMERGAGDESDAAYLETQAKMLESDELAVEVIRKLHLDQNPEFVNTSKPNQRAADIASNAATIQLNPAENAALATFQAQLKVRRDTGSRLIIVAFASHDPGTAARVANELVSEFNENNFKALHEAIMQTSAWLSSQLDDIRTKMDQSRLALVEFQKRTGIADLDANKSTLADQVSELDQQLASARGDRIQLEAQLEKARDGSPESLPQSGNNPLIQNLLQKLAEARTELSQAQVEYGRNHPALRKLESEVNQLETELDSQKQRIFTQVQTSYSAAQSREHLLEGERKVAVAQLNQTAEFNNLKKDLQTETDLYNALYARVKEAAIAAAANSNNVRIIDHARVLEKPTRPKVLFNLAFGLFFAVFGGLALAFLREAAETRIHTSEDILNATGLPSVSVMPVINGYAAGTSALDAAVVPRLRAGNNSSVSKFLLEQPSSVEAEALRSLCTTVMLSHGERPPQALLVVSGSPGEGKSTIASNMAIALAQRGPTCLVDADLRKAGVSHSFGLDSCAGLANVLAHAAELAEVLTPAGDVPRLSIVPAGSADRNPGELIAREDMERVVSALRERFDFVVIDSPPILPYAEGRVLSTLVDGLIFVGRYGATTRAAMAKAIEMLSAIHAAPVLEVVLNGTNTRASGYYYYYGQRQS